MRSIMTSASLPYPVQRTALACFVLGLHVAGLVLIGRAPPPSMQPSAQPVLQVALIQDRPAERGGVAASPVPPPVSPRPRPQVRTPVPKPQAITPRPGPVTEQPATRTPTLAGADTPAAPTGAAAVAAAPSVATAPVPVTAARFDAAYLNNPAPAYPPLSRRMGEAGQVMLKVLVSAAGLPARIELARTSGSDRLDRAAREAVARWRFIAARQGEQDIEAWVLVPVIFKLQEN